jgi:hypothetical protein
MINKVEKLENINLSAFKYNPADNKDLKRLEENHEEFYGVNAKSGLKVLKKEILRYIILMYDKNTPLRIMYTGFNKRKGYAAIMAGFKRDPRTGKFNNAVKDVILGKNDDVNKAIVRYLMFFYDADYLQLIIYYELLGKQYRTAMEDGQKALSNTNVQAIEKIREEINRLTEKIFGNEDGSEESKDLEIELYRALEIEKETLHPDFVARQWTDGEEPFKDMVDG